MASCRTRTAFASSCRTSSRRSTKAGGTTGAVTHSYWSEFFRRFPLDLIGDLEVDEPGGPIHHGRFHTMTGYNGVNQMTPSDGSPSVAATLTMR